MQQALEGGCFCGAVRFRINGLVDSATHCHCEFCRRSVGAPLVTWVSVRRDEIEWSGAEPRAYRHRSDWPTPIVRRFCGECGTSLTYEREGSEDLDVTAVSLDDCEAVRPDHHVYISRRVSWLPVADDLPQYETNRSDSE